MIFVWRTGIGQQTANERLPILLEHKAMARCTKMATSEVSAELGRFTANLPDIQIDTVLLDVDLLQCFVEFRATSDVVDYNDPAVGSEDPAKLSHRPVSVEPVERLTHGDDIN